MTTLLLLALYNKHILIMLALYNKHILIIHIRTMATYMHTQIHLHIHLHMKNLLALYNKYILIIMHTHTYYGHIHAHRDTLANTLTYERKRNYGI